MSKNDKTIYVVTREIIHTNLYEVEEDGTDIIGVYDDRELAEWTLVQEYDRDKRELLEGSCKPDGEYEIAESTLATTRDDEGREAHAYIQVCEKNLGTLDREYTYNITTKTLNA